ncbi:MAG: hypothetical protein A2314_09555 [Elusimicrobia bacterium RIFOXYB2_FULL_50_12]|nr:MAG: hypothetical protein A2314_09555 [Elusimicrobia bacterium RIFOXYB2_FULL_50_12]
MHIKIAINVPTAMSFFSILFVIGFEKNALAVTIDSLSGAPNNGNLISISGSGYGSNSAVRTGDIQWLGDNIELGNVAAEFSPPPNWSYHRAETTFDAPHYDNLQAHSGNKSIRITYDLNKYGGYFNYNHESAFGKVFYSAWMRIAGPSSWTCNGTSGGCQYKNGGRITSGVIDLGRPQFYTSTWTEQGNFVVFMQTSSDTEPGVVSDYPHNTGSAECYQWMCPGPTGERRYLLNGPHDTVGPNTNSDMWVRIDWYAEESSPLVKNGTFKMVLQKPGEIINTVLDFDKNLQTTDGSDYYKSIFFGTYASGFSKLDTWWDDIFIQTGGQQRVEIGDTSEWSTNTHREIQIPVSWSDNSISFIFNQGSFQNGSRAYLFVVNEAGSVNSGYPITIGGQLSDIAPPTSPRNFNVH